MKRLLLATLFAVGFAGSALAGQCPIDMGKIDKALAAGPGLSAEDMAKVKLLRAQGEAMHKAGKHGDSVATLAKAKKMLGLE